MPAAQSRQRARRDRRHPNPPPIRLTARDQQIIRTVYACRVLTTAQLQRLFFPSMHRAYARLAALYHHKFLDRRFLGVASAKMNNPLLYALDRRGADWLRAAGHDVHWRPAHKNVGDAFLAHRLGINDVRVAVTTACRQSRDFELLTWLDDSDLKADYDRVTIQTAGGHRKRVAVIPDSFLRLATPRGKTAFCLELDRGTMTLKRFKTKILAYQAYVQTGGYQAKFKTRSLRVLTVTTSPVRADNLRRMTAQAGGQHRFWFTTLAQVKAAGQDVLAQPLWQVAAKTGVYPLIDRVG